MKYSNVMIIIQGRINDVDATQNSWPKTRADQTTCQGRTRLAGHQAGLHGSAGQVQQVRVEGRHSEVPLLDGRVRLLLIVALAARHHRPETHRSTTCSHVTSFYLERRFSTKHVPNRNFTNTKNCLKLNVIKYLS